jgi:hypothetical protein
MFLVVGMKVINDQLAMRHWAPECTILISCDRGGMQIRRMHRGPVRDRRDTFLTRI